ncbi:hypothetical protein L7F22_031927 [Adiantum nelumboides]|nr:hypothetical protein [Adiantum nelumboides]
METLAYAKIWANSTCFIPSHHRSSVSVQKAQRLVGRRMFHARVGWPQSRHFKSVICRNELHSDGTGHPVEDDYVNSTILEAVEVKSGSEGFLIRMQDGRYIKCVHNNPDGGRLPDYAPQPAIMLKMEDGSDLLQSIIVLELPAAMLMETVRKVHLARPTIYQVLKDLVELMGFKVKLVRVTKRVQEAYYAQLLLSKQVGDEVQEVSLDLRPSDAINIAARCQVPIQVNRQLVYVIKELDRPQADELSSLEAEEFVLVRSLFMAAAEERYIDAARIRDELKELRLKEGN